MSWIFLYIFLFCFWAYFTHNFLNYIWQLLHKITYSSLKLAGWSICNFLIIGNLGVCNNRFKHCLKTSFSFQVLLLCFFSLLLWTKSFTINWYYWRLFLRNCLFLMINFLDLSLRKIKIEIFFLAFKTLFGDRLSRINIDFILIEISLSLSISHIISCTLGLIHK